MKPTPGVVLAGKYQLDRILGEGGTSTVFAAVNTLTGKQVAIKWLQPELMADDEQTQRLVREAQLASSIDHPNVVNVFDLGSHEGAIFLVMELLHGETLSELFERGRLTPVELLQVMMPVFRGVHAAHQAGVIHRDLKPDNTFLCRGPNGEAREPKVLDFGISKLEDPRAKINGRRTPGGSVAPLLTRDGIVFGTPQYTSPEQFRDARSADARSDVYALGVIFYVGLSGRHPYDGETISELAIRTVEGGAQPLCELRPDLHPDLSSAVMRAMALDPAERFASVAALAEALEPFSGGVPFVVPMNAKTGVARWSTPVAVRALSSLPPPPRSSAFRQKTMELDLRDAEFLETPPPARRAKQRRFSSAMLLALAAVLPTSWLLWEGRELVHAATRSLEGSHQVRTPVLPVARSAVGASTPAPRSPAAALVGQGIIVEQLHVAPVEDHTQAAVTSHGDGSAERTQRSLAERPQRARSNIVRRVEAGGSAREQNSDPGGARELELGSLSDPELAPRQPSQPAHPPSTGPDLLLQTEGNPYLRR